MNSTAKVNDVAYTSGASYNHSRKRIRNIQKIELARLMKANFLFIRGKHAVPRYNMTRAEVWEMIAGRINSLGPPIQSADAWQKRWNDMRLATKNKMTKVSEYGKSCSFKQNLVERLIWDTFSVKPEEYMKDLNMKLWREKRQQDHVRLGQHSSNPVPVPTDSESVSSADVSLDLGFEMGRGNQLQTTTHESAPGSSWQGPSVQSCEMADPGRPEDPMMVVDQASYYSQFASTAGFGSYPTVGGSYSGTPMSGGRSMEEQAWQSIEMSSGHEGDISLVQEKNLTAPWEKLPLDQVLEDFHIMCDLILRQNEDILNLLRKSSGDP